MLLNQFHKANSGKKFMMRNRCWKITFVQNSEFDVNIILFAHFGEGKERIKKLLIRFT